MRLPPFELERYFAEREFSAEYLLCSSDCEPYALKDLLLLADSESRCLWEELRLGYTESQGHPKLRDEVSSMYRKVGARDVLILTPEEGIFTAMNVLLARDDHVVVTYPGYQSLYEVARSLNCRVDFWQPSPAASWRFDPGDLKRLIRPDTRMIVVNSPHNPTGAVIGGDDFSEIVRLADSHGIIIFSDEMYRFLEYDAGIRPRSAADEYPLGISLGGLSKGFALAGLRIGWLATRNQQWLGRLSAFKDYTTICNSAPSEILALMALRSRNTILKRNLNIIRKNLALFSEFLIEFSDTFSCSMPEGGSVAFPRLLSQTDVNNFCESLFEAKGVLLLPGTTLGFKGNHFRIGLGREDFPQGLSVFRDYLQLQF